MSASELAAGPSAISEVTAPAAGDPDTMHSEAEESKEGRILISLGASQLLRRNVEEGRSKGADGSLTVSRGYFVLLPCALTTLLELRLPDPVPFSPRSPSERMAGRARPSSQPATKGCVVDFSGNGTAPGLTSRMQNGLGIVPPVSGNPVA